MLYTIPMSHYCEAARWALELAGIDFVEAAYLPGLHAAFSPIVDLRKGSKAPPGLTGSESSVPLLVSVDKEIIAHDSWECMSRLGDAPPLRAKELLDTIIGPCARTIAYSHLLADEGDAAFLKACTPAKVPWMQRWAMASSPFRWKVKAALREGLVRSQGHVEDCRTRLRTALTEFEAFLYMPPYADAGPTVAAVALASLMAPLVLPPNYAVTFYEGPMLEMEDLPPAMREEVAAWRNTPVGAWTLEYYKAHRRPDPEMSC